MKTWNDTSRELRLVHLPALRAPDLSNEELHQLYVAANKKGAIARVSKIALFNLLRDHAKLVAELRHIGD